MLSARTTGASAAANAQRKLAITSWRLLAVLIVLCRNDARPEADAARREARATEAASPRSAALRSVPVQKLSHHVLSGSLFLTTLDCGNRMSQTDCCNLPLHVAVRGDSVGRRAFDYRCAMVDRRAGRMERTVRICSETQLP